MALRVLVADDAALYRKVISDALNAMPNVEVVGTAVTGRAALARIVELKPDLVTLDIEMPGMNGLEVLEALQALPIQVGVIVLSALTVHGGDLTMRALELGAFDFLTKPVAGNLTQHSLAIQQALEPIVQAFARRHQSRPGTRPRPQGAIALPQPAPPTVRPTPAPPPASPRAAAGLSQVTQRMQQLARARSPELVVIGISTGGPNALLTLVPALPANLNVPILIVQHMPPLFTKSLASSLNAKSALIVKEAEHEDALRPNTIYIAPGGKQMKVGSTASGAIGIIITDDPPENNCKPSVDYLFRSVAHLFPGKATGVIMTGMGSDGVLGLRLMKRHGGTMIAQDEESCVVFGMPREAIKAGVVDLVVPLDGMANAIAQSVRGIPG